MSVSASLTCQLQLPKLRRAGRYPKVVREKTTSHRSTANSLVVRRGYMYRVQMNRGESIFFEEDIGHRSRRLREQTGTKPCQEGIFL